MSTSSNRNLIVATTLLFALWFSIGTALANPVNDIIDQYQQQDALTANHVNGEELWKQTFENNKSKQKRSCTSCHTDNLRAIGKHIRTKKTIEPLAPSVNKERLTDIKKIEKWFKRNCKWTMGRECSPQEKIDFLSYIRRQ